MAPSLSLSAGGWRRFLVALGGLDSRSLACFRVLVGGVILYDVYLAWSVLEVWPGMQGFFEGLPLPQWAMPSGEEGFLRLVFGLYALLALGLMAGWHARLCALGVWIAACGHQYAAGHTADYHDAVLCHALLWAQFMDLGEQWSLDARRKGLRRRRDGLALAGGSALALNLAWIYVSTVWEKSDPSWWGEGTALWFALRDLALTGPLGLWSVEHVPFAFFQMLTWLVLGIEAAGALLLVHPRTRLGGILLLMGLHGGMWVLMRLESFPLTMIAVLSALLPSGFWDRLGSRTQAAVLGERSRLERGVLWALLAGSLFVLAEGARLEEAEGDEWPYPGAAWVARSRAFLGLELFWEMYAPGPPSFTGWWVGVAHTADNREVDPITWEKPTFARPDRGRLPFDGLGSVYWFEYPEEDGSPHHQYAHFFLWMDDRRHPPEQRLTHFLLFYVYEPFLPIQQGAHAAKPLLVMRWPDLPGFERPPLLEDSTLRGVRVHEVDFERLGEEGWEPVVLPPLETY